MQQRNCPRHKAAVFTVAPHPCQLVSTRHAQPKIPFRQTNCPYLNIRAGPLGAAAHLTACVSNKSSIKQALGMQSACPVCRSRACRAEGGRVLLASPSCPAVLAPLDAWPPLPGLSCVDNPPAWPPGMHSKHAALLPLEAATHPVQGALLQHRGALLEGAAQLQQPGKGACKVLQQCPGGGGGHSGPEAGRERAF